MKRAEAAASGVWTGAQKWVTGGLTMLAALMALLVNAKNLGISEYAGFVTFSVADHAAHRVVLSPRSDTLRAIGEPAVITATVTDARGAALSGATLHWKSSDSTIASVDSSGLIVARAPGRATIEVRVRDVIASAAVLVRPHAEFVHIAGDSALRVADGEARRLKATVLDGRGHPIAGVDAGWMVDDPRVLTIDSTGTLRANAPGRATVWAIVGELRDTLLVDVVLTPAEIVVVSGDGQHALAGRPLPAPVVLQVRTRTGEPVPGTSVSLSAEEGEGELSLSTATTDEQGRVRFTWKLGGTAGAQHVFARIPSLDSARAISADAEPAPGNTKIEVLSSEVRGMVRRELESPVRVRVTDSAGTALATVRVAWTALDGGAAAGSERTDENGNAEVKWTLGPRSGAQRLLVQVGNPRFIPATTVRAEATADQVVALAVLSGDRQRSTSGSALAKPVVVLAKDSLGNPVAGATIVAKPSAGTLMDTVLTTGADGRVTARWMLGTKPGEQKLEFAVEKTKARAAVTASARVGPAATVTIRAAAARATTGQRLEAIAVDQHGNPVSGAMLQFSATAGTLNVAQAKTDARGLAPVTWTKPASLRTDARITVRVPGTKIAATHVVVAPSAVTRPASGQAAATKKAPPRSRN